MRQLIKPLNKGDASVVEVPAPTPKPGEVLVATAASLVSAGTERATVEFANKSLIQKARSRPDLVKQVIEKAKRDGVLTALDAARSRLSEPIALGYSSAGSVISVGRGVSRFSPGDRVACAGAGFATHAEVVSVPENLVAKLPDSVDYEAGAFVTLGSIAMHGLRLSGPQLGETVAVIGLGLVGQIASQLARSAGCRVLGVDPDPRRGSIALALGCAAVFSDGTGLEEYILANLEIRGVDRVLICAATPTSGPVELAGKVARDRGSVVAIGDVGLDIPRRLYYDKELEFRVSRSYGPGRYDSQYEIEGRDYPAGYVRWTENRNMQAFVDLIGLGEIKTEPLVTHRFPIADAAKAYDLLSPKAKEPSLAVLITYEGNPSTEPRMDLKPASIAATSVDRVNVGMLGAGEFAKSTLIPAMKKTASVELVGVCTTTGLSASQAGQKFGFAYSTTDESDLISDSSINTVVIATRHNLHARQVVAAIEAGKHVFCEKPLALNANELREVILANGSQEGQTRQMLMVGFNRRFADMAQKMQAFFSDISEPLVMNYRVNAGYIPSDHWTQDDQIGGGRAIGEVCHFVDFLGFLSGSLPISINASALPNGSRYNNDNLALVIEYENGSVGNIVYAANGSTTMSKERIEVFGGGRSAILDDFRRLELMGHGNKKTYKSRLKQNKGHQGEWSALAAAMLSAGEPPIAFEELVATSLATFSALESLQTGLAQPINTRSFIQGATSGLGVGE